MTINALGEPIGPGVYTGDAEHDTVAGLVRAARDADIRADPIAVANFYVALKSKPLSLLVGQAHSGKIALIRCFAGMLFGSDSLHCQMMVGHPWWAGRSGDVALCTHAQARLNTEKIWALVEDASQPENANHLFIACLTRISPAEVSGFFSEVAFQLQHERLMSLPGEHLVEPIPFPPNLLLIGTLDADQFDEADADLLSQTTVIRWQAEADLIKGSYQTPICHAAEREFLQSRIHSEQAACLKLHRVLGWRPQTCLPLDSAECLLTTHSVEMRKAVIGELLIYLANAWSRSERGLFDPEPCRNLAIAFDLAVAQVLLPRIHVSSRRAVALRRQLCDMLAEGLGRVQMENYQGRKR